MIREICVRTAVIVLLLAVVTAVAAPRALAQDRRDWNRIDDVMEGAVGLHYGKLGGNGLSFRAPIEWWLYVQASGGIWHTADRKQHNLGLQLDYLLRQDDRLRIFVVGGVSHWYRRENVAGDGEPELFEERKDWNVGAGIGLEILQGARWSWLIEADFVRDGRRDEIKVAPQVGIYFYW